MLFTNWKQKYIEQHRKEEMYLKGLAIQASIFKHRAEAYNDIKSFDIARIIIRQMSFYAKEFNLMDYLTKLYETYPELKERKEE